MKRMWHDLWGTHTAPEAALDAVAANWTIESEEDGTDAPDPAR